VHRTTSAALMPVIADESAVNARLRQPVPETV